MKKGLKIFSFIIIALLSTSVLYFDIWAMPAQEVISEASANGDKVNEAEVDKRNFEKEDQNVFLDEEWDDPENWRDMEISVAGVNTFNDFSHKSENPGTIRQGIDVSSHQGDIDWESVSSSGVEFAIIRGAYRGYGTAGTLRSDTMFAQNIAGAKAAGLKVGVYIYP